MTRLRAALDAVPRSWMPSLLVVALGSCSYDASRLARPLTDAAGPDESRTADSPPEVAVPDGPGVPPDPVPDALLVGGDGARADAWDAPPSPDEGSNPIDGPNDSVEAEGAVPDLADATGGTSDAEAGAGDALGDAATSEVSGDDGASVGTGGSIGTGGTVGTGGSGGTGGSLTSTGGATGTGGGGSGTGGTSGTGGATTCVWGAFQAPELLTGFGLDGYSLWGPSLSADGKTVFFGADNASVLEHIYMATRPDRGTAFAAATAVDGVRGYDGSDGTPCISADGLTLYFYSTRSGGVGARDLWSASRASATAAFASAKLLAGPNGTSNDYLPWISADELTLMFSSSRGGSTDVYSTKRAKRTDNFPAPTALAGVNGASSNEERAAWSNDGLTIYFSSNRAGGVGDVDIWVGTRADLQRNFGGLTNLRVVNSTSEDVDVSLSRDETELVFASSRSGQSRLYRSVRGCQ
jgi:hypothetical protein